MSNKIKKFVTSTSGLMARLYGKGRPVMVRIEIYETEPALENKWQGGFILEPVSGINLSRVPGSHATITREAMDDAPSGNVARSRWALALCDWEA